MNQDHDLYILLISTIVINGSIIGMSIFFWKILWMHLAPFKLTQNISEIYDLAGFDGLTLLEYQKSILQALVTFTIAYILGYIFSSLVSYLLTDYQKLFVQLNLVPCQDFLITSGLLLVILYFLIRFRLLLQEIFLQAFRSDPASKYRIRSLHINNLKPTDYQGTHAILDLLKQLNDKGNHGTIMAIIVLPEYTKLLQLENLRLQNQFAELMGVYSKSVESKIDKQLERSFKLSGHAFLCTDRIQTALTLLEDTNVQPLPYLRDINWLNITIQSRGFIFYRTVILNLIIATLLIFVTSPSALYQYLSQIDGLQFLSFKWTIEIPDPFGKILLNNIPPLFVVGINQVIMQLLDVITISERHARYSRYQLSLMQKMYFYMLLNVLVIPAFFLQSSQTLFNLIYNGFYLDIQKFDNKHSKSIEYYYFTFLVQSGSVSFMVQLLRPTELLWNGLSPYVTHHMRMYEQDTPDFRRTKEFCLQYGYISAQMLLILSIICIFSVNQPLILFAGIWYFSLRLIGDAYTLQVVNRQEIESDGRYIIVLLQLTCFTMALWLLIKIISCYLQANYMMMGLFSGLLFMWCVVTFYLIQPLIDLRKISDQDLRANWDNEMALQEWKTAYQHPLLQQI